MSALSKSMTLTEFDNGYWYAAQLQDFGKTLGIPSAKRLRKDELEKAIRHFLTSGEIENPARRPLNVVGRKDSDVGLSLDLEVKIYTNNKETKDFLEREALKLNPDMKRKSGARYRLNRWREEQRHEGVLITYRDLVTEYVRLNSMELPFAKIPHGRYINFVSDYHASKKGASSEEISKAWETLKRLDMPKTFEAWAKWRKRNKG